jgi:hypothetical protein
LLCKTTITPQNGKTESKFKGARYMIRPAAYARAKKSALTFPQNANIGGSYDIRQSLP